MRIEFATLKATKSAMAVQPCKGTQRTEPKMRQTATNPKTVSQVSEVIFEELVLKFEICLSPVHPTHNQH